jgi:hypothetical protein
MEIQPTRSKDEIKMKKMDRVGLFYIYFSQRIIPTTDHTNAKLQTARKLISLAVACHITNGQAIHNQRL